MQEVKHYLKQIPMFPLLSAQVCLCFPLKHEITQPAYPERRAGTQAGAELCNARGNITGKWLEWSCLGFAGISTLRCLGTER